MNTKRKQEPKAQAIETHYKNTRFRSRLEAKWALYFDSLGMDWLYESEGYTSRGVYYLPDFFLPSQKLLIEARPTPPTIEDLQKSAIGVEASGVTLIYTWGLPAIPAEEDNFEMVAPEYFLMNNTRFMPIDLIRWPKHNNQYGAIAIDYHAARSLLDGYDLESVRGIECGGLQSAEIALCQKCKRFNFVSSAFVFGWALISYQHSKVCRYGCKAIDNDHEDGFDERTAAAIKAHNHRFGKIA